MCHSSLERPAPVLPSGVGDGQDNGSNHNPCGGSWAARPLGWLWDSAAQGSPVLQRPRMGRMQTALQWGLSQGQPPAAGAAVELKHCLSGPARTTAPVMAPPSLAVGSAGPDLLGGQLTSQPDCNPASSWWTCPATPGPCPALAATTRPALLPSLRPSGMGPLLVRPLPCWPCYPPQLSSCCSLANGSRTSREANYHSTRLIHSSSSSQTLIFPQRSSLMLDYWENI